MGSSKIFAFLFLQLIFLFSANGQGLKVGFYKSSCPQAEYIINKIALDTIKKAPTLAAPLLRIHFHDCFVRGCDGSVFLESSKNNTEKNAIPNLSLRGWHIIDKVKTALEKACPGIVSCADISAVLARDMVAALKGATWEVETGRRDGSVSVLQEALQNLPSPFMNISQLISNFNSVGLNVKDLVVLSGGHTIGTSHCAGFTNRIYNFTGKGDTDPSLDSEYIPKLRSKCKPRDQTTLVEMDPGSFKTFDEEYFTLVSKRRGLFQSDAALLDNAETKAYIKLQSRTHGATFFNDFGVSMVKMGRIGVKTGQAGEIRKVCSKTN